MLYIIFGLAAAFCLACVLAYQMGNTPREILHMAAHGAREAAAVAMVLLFIGMVTGIWRGAGTIVEFVVLGVSLIRPSLFLLIAFLTSCLLSYALGTSFGVAGTVGVIFMTLARSGGVNPVITGGVLLSGVFFGDRSSPAASTASMVSHLTGTDLIGNVKRMAVSGILPFLACLAVYAVLSFKNPIRTVDESVIKSFQSVFNISPWTLIPAVFLLVLPLLRVPILWCMTASIVSGAVVARVCQNMAWTEIVRTLFLGYECPEIALQNILDGGGMKSMWDSCVIITLACGTSGIFKQAGMLHRLQNLIRKASEKISTFPMMILTSLCASAIFCNQVIAIVMCTALFKDIFKSMGRSKEALALDIENICITIPAFIPWSIICAVPLKLLGTDYRSMGFAVYLYAVPLINWILRAKNGYAAKELVYSLAASVLLMLFWILFALNTFDALNRARRDLAAGHVTARRAPWVRPFVYIVLTMLAVAAVVISFGFGRHRNAAFVSLESWSEPLPVQTWGEFAPKEYQANREDDFIFENISPFADRIIMLRQKSVDNGKLFYDVDICQMKTPFYRQKLFEAFVREYGAEPVSASGDVAYYHYDRYQVLILQSENTVVRIGYNGAENLMAVKTDYEVKTE